MHIHVPDIAARELLHYGAHVRDGLLGNLLQKTRGYYASRRTLRGRYCRHDGQDLTRIRADDRKTVYASDFGAADDCKLIIAGSLRVVVRDLVFHRTCNRLGFEDMLDRGNLCVLLPCHIAGNTDKTAHVTEFERDMSFAVASAPCLAHNLLDGAAVKRRDLAVVVNLLRNETDELPLVLGRVRHRILHEDLVTVSSDTGTQRRVHSFHRIEVARRYHDKAAGDRLGLDHRTRRPLALTRYRELALLKSGEQILLGMRRKRVDFVDEENTLVCLVNRTRLDPLVCGCLETSRLEGVVTDIAQKCAGMRARAVYVGCIAVRLVGDKELGDHYLFFRARILKRHEYESRAYDTH